MKVTLKDIAEDTGYSISTVSRVLNGFDTNPETKKEIIQSAKKLNYPIQNYMDDFESNGILEVLLLTGIEVGEFYASFFDGLNKAANREKVKLSLYSLENDVPKVQDIAEKIQKEDFDGLIINLPRFNMDQYQKLQDILPEDFPVVSNEVLDNQIFDTVGFDNYGGGHNVGRHFVEQGYESCGIIHGPRDKNVSRQRAHGFEDIVLSKSGINLTWEFEGDFSFQSGIDAFYAFEEVKDKPRAIFACNDNMGHAFIQEAMVKGYKFPEDIALVGFDDLPICSRHRPTISSIHTNYENLGAVSIQKMKEILANPNQPRGFLNLVPTKFIKRKSS